MKLEKIKGPHYYGSDLNKFVDEKCSHQMDCINVDCLMVKCAKKRLRFIESKNENEYTPKSETRAFNILRFLVARLPENIWKIEFFIVSGNYPYENGAEIYEWGNEEATKVSQEKLIQWLNFETEI